MPRSSSSVKRKAEYHFDREAANHACEFFERYLKHSQGRWAGCRFELLPWQMKIIRRIFGWKRRDGTRRYRRVYIEIPKKNGKSTLAAGIALYLLVADHEPGAMVYSAAGDIEQAALVFETAKTMVEMSPELRKFIKPFRRSLVVPRTRSTYRVISAEARTKHGPNISGIVFDELHVQPNRELWDALTAGVAARKQPLIVAITTAGYDRNSICWEQHEYAQRVIRNPKMDPSFLGVIFAAGEKDDWTSPRTWVKANKSLGITITKEYLAGECARAKESPAYQNTFRRLHLNEWTSQESRWIPMDKWDKCGGSIAVEGLAGKQCYGGLDLASSADTASLVLDFPDTEGNHTFLLYCWTPAENIRERSLRDRVNYEVWARQGFITATAGNVIDYAFIRAKVEELANVFDIREIAFDRWGAVQITQELTEAGITVVPFGQGYASMSPPTKQLLTLLLGGKVRHGGNPVLTWMADNVMVKQDPAGNLKPDKARSREKIDGIVAMIMALDRATRHEDKDAESVYEAHGVVTL